MTIRGRDRPIRIGLIGTGGIAGAHVASFHAVDNVRIVAIWNRTRSRAEALSKNQAVEGARIYDSWESMIRDANLDAVSIVTAPQLRAGPVVAALRAGLHVLVEKPFATTLGEADAMVRSRAI